MAQVLFEKIETHWDHIKKILNNEKKKLILKKKLTFLAAFFQK